jgi:hypothetical protein
VVPGCRCMMPAMPFDALDARTTVRAYGITVLLFIGAPPCAGCVD